MYTFLPKKKLFNKKAGPRRVIDYDRMVTKKEMPCGDGIVTAGFIKNREQFSRPAAPFSATNIVIKEPGTAEHKVPERYARFLPVLKQIANYEFSHSDKASEKRATLLVEHIIPEEDYPQGTWHQEHTGMIGDKVKPFHVYTVSDIFTTIVQNGKLENPAYGKNGFFIKKGRRHIHDENMDVPADIRDSHFRKLKPYEIGLMTGQNIHRADSLPKGQRRTLLRVIYEIP